MIKKGQSVNILILPLRQHISSRANERIIYDKWMCIMHDQARLYLHPGRD